MSEPEPLTDRQCLWRWAEAAGLVGELEAAGLLDRVIDMIPPGVVPANGWGQAAERGRALLAETRAPVGAWFTSAKTRARHCGGRERRGNGRG